MIVFISKKKSATSERKLTSYGTRKAVLDFDHNDYFVTESTLTSWLAKIKI